MSITITVASLANQPDDAARSVLELMPQLLTPCEVAAFASALVKRLAHELYEDEPEADYTIAALSAAVSLAFLVEVLGQHSRPSAPRTLASSGAKRPGAEPGVEALDKLLALLEHGLVAEILKQVAALLGDEASELQSSEAGRELFSAVSHAGLRDAGFKVKAAIQAGKLVLSPEALARVMPYVAELTG